MFKDKRSFFERITGSVPYEEADEEAVIITSNVSTSQAPSSRPESSKWFQDNIEEEGELTVDVYQTPTEVVVQSMVAGVKPEDLNISITREMITIKGKRERPSDASGAGYVHKELYWGSFSRSIMLPAEVEVEQAEAVERHGLLSIRLPKTDKERVQKIKVRSI